MSEQNLQQELARLRTRVATLELLLEVHEKSVLEQATYLEQRVNELHQRAEERAQSEAEWRSQKQILQLILDNLADGVAVADLSGRFLFINPAARLIPGFDQLGDRVLSPEQWSADYGLFLPDQVTPYPTDQLPLVRAMRGEEVRGGEVFVRRGDQTEGTWLSVNARPLRDESGSLRGGVAVFRNISARRRAERRGAAQYAVTKVLAEAASLAEAAPRIVEALCTAVGWDMGALWSVEATAAGLRCVDAWQVPGHAFDEFEQVTRATCFKPGIGLPGRVWASKEPVWIPDIQVDENFSRFAAAARVGLHGGVAFPILFDHKVTGVIEFFSRLVRPVDRDFLAMLAVLGSQIGQFVERKRTEENLRASRERFELAVLGSRDGVWDWDMKTDTVFHSPRWRSMLGIEPGDCSEPFREWESRLHPEDRDRAMQALENYLKGGKSIYEVEYRLLHNDGQYRWILDRGVAQCGFDGKPHRMAGSHTDITERKNIEQELRHQEALYHSLVETLPLAIFRKDLEGQYTFCNQRFADTVQRTPEEIKGLTDFKLCPKEDAERFQAIDRQVLEINDVVEVIDEHRRPGGEQVFVHVLKSPIHDEAGNRIGVQGMFWDVTAHQRAKQELERAKEAAEAANRAKSEFLANVSHEIRTPMNGILGMTELALDTELTSVQRDYLELVRSSADSLLAIINDILDYSKIEAGKLDLDLHAFSLRDTLGDTLRMLDARASKQGLELIFDTQPDVPDVLIGDSGRLRQIVINLVGNAIKFTEKGEVVVTVELEEPLSSGEAHLHVTVRDTGIGIPVEKQQAIFNAFEQADGSTTRRYGGTGLGLTIAARLVEMMAGRIWVESKEGRGSAFHFTAMFGFQPGTEAKRQEMQPRELLDLPVLIVDDNATNRLILEQNVRSWHMRPVCAASGPAALELLEQARGSGEPFALVLLDAHMPDMDGFGLAERIQQRPDLAGAMLMMLTSGGQPDDIERCRALGIRTYLRKPVKQSDLLDGIIATLGHSVVLREPDTQESQPGRGLRILVAEDNAVNQRLTLDLLHKRGHQVSLADNGRIAVERTQQETFDVVLMDVQMPEVDGFEATAAIRAREAERGGHLPILAMTAHAMTGDREKCLAAGMDGYISKPVQAAELFRILEGTITPTVDEAAPAAAGLAVVDWKRALAHMGDDEEILRSVVEVFLAEWPKWRRSFAQSFAQGDAPTLRRTAHTIKGSLNTLGAADAYELAQQLETLGRDANLADARTTYEALEREVENLTAVFASYVRGERPA